VQNKFQDLWKNYLKANKGSIDNAARQSFDNDRNKYIKGIDAIEEKLSSKTIFPGKIYTFLYSTEQKPSSDRPFIDRRPIFLSMGPILKEGKKLETGLDLNLIPPLIRIQILGKVWDTFNSSIEQNMKDLASSKTPSKQLTFIPKVAEQILRGSGYTNAVITLDRSKMRNVKIVDYNDWPSLCVLYTRGIEGISIVEIYNSYIKKYDKLNIDPLEF
jgi:hypothetical protein